MIYDATIFDLSEPGAGFLGLPRLYAAGTRELWGKGGDVEAMPTRFGKLYQSEGGRIPDDWTVILDIEHWHDKERMIEAATLYRQHYPGRHVGHYGFAPAPDYWRAIRGKFDEKYKEWRKENDNMKGFANAVDTLYPVCYTHYKDPAAWVRMAEAQIDEAKRMGERVCPFIWFEYHDNSLFKREQLDYEFFRLQLEVCLGLAGNVAVWGGWQREFNEQDPWARAIKDVQR